MQTRFYKPHPLLQPVVNNIMISFFEFDKAKPKPAFPFPPLPEQCLFFYPFDKMDVQYDDEKKQQLPSAIILGPQTKRSTITMGHRHLVIKIGFQPGALHRLLGIPMVELASITAVDAIDFFGKEISTVNEQVCEAAGFDEMKTIMENFLSQKIKNIKPQLPIDAVLPAMINKGGLGAIEDFASHACLSSRQFERVFKNRMGFSPKFFSRLVRFANAWVLKETSPQVSWTKIAYHCGYYDQMHLIKDFKEFAGANPSEIEKALAETPVSLNNRLFC
ncbi:MAG TPA: helix-turn-helix domain-containing protein [Flavisolibacter sp.]|jgi:AraC-like DNA-binding protein|nr:helix-turn-helix domain-containing protein [Flavisolibacter sp.]